MTPKELKEALARAEDLLQRSSEAHDRALLAVANLRAMAQLMFMISSDKAYIVDEVTTCN
jgi:hypothetical protein